MNEVQRTQQQLQDASRPTELPPTPSFEPWLVHVRTLRAGITCLAMLVTTLKLGWSGTDWIDAVLTGMAAAIVAFFIAWAGVLWVCSELYGGEVRRARAAWANRERVRQQQIRDAYRQRMNHLHGTGGNREDTLDNLIEFSPPSSGSEQAGSTPNTWQQQAA